MTQTDLQIANLTVGEDWELTAAEIEAWRRQDLFVDPADFAADDYPRMTNLSAGFFYRGVIRPTDPAPPEYVTVPIAGGFSELALAVAEWNMLWEAAQYRRRKRIWVDIPG